MNQQPELPDEIDGVPIRKPGSVYLPEQLAPVKGDEPINTKYLVRIDNLDDDLEKCVRTATSLGGTKYLGLYSNRDLGAERIPVFESEFDPQTFLKLMLEAGVKVRGIILLDTYVNGFQTTRALVPTWIKCDGCGRVMSYQLFSRSGQSLCDGCLSAAIEIPEEDAE